MSLASGSRLGPYEIIGALGAGGMGEVYKARDTRLDRAVAIKVLPAAFAADVERRARFEREARAIAALSHPNICVLHDVGRQDDIDYLVMELLEGQTLADKLSTARRGAHGHARVGQALAIDEVIRCATQIADALEKAHRAAIVHRDLKPANIMLTKSGVKLLDFGLAKLRGPSLPASMTTVERADGAGPTTEAGTILGTMHYMSPEQVEGREADARSDLWALGVIIYEMATGALPFDGESGASIIGAILRDVPAPVSSRQPLSPASLDHIVERCLEKDPDERWQSAADIKGELNWAARAPHGAIAAAQSQASSRRRSGVILAGVLAGALCGAAAIALLRPSAAIDTSVLRLEVTAPPHASFGTPQATLPSPQIALSPDGKWLAFVAREIGSDATLWIRPIDGTTATPLTATEEATYPFWSPDSRTIAFFAQGKLKRIDIRAGAPQELCDAVDARGGSWSRDDVIVYALNNTGLWRIPAAGGTPTVLTTLEAGETGHRWPSFLPDGQHLLYTTRAVRQGDSVVGITSLDGSVRKRLFTSAFGAVAVGDQVLSLNDGVLTSQRLDERQLALVGESTPIANGVAGSTVLYGSFTASRTGLLAFASQSDAPTRLNWFSRDGRPLGPLGAPGNISDVRFTPDGKRALITRTDRKTNSANIWSLDAATGDAAPITFEPAIAAQAVISPDGRELIYRSTRELPAVLLRRPLAGTAADAVMLHPRDLKLGPHDSGNLFPSDWSRDGRFILFYAAFAETSYDVFSVVAGEHTVHPVVRSRGSDLHPRFSPDARWVAYSSSESGRTQVYVQSFPDGTGRWQLSTQGGAEPRWRGDGKEVFFLAPDGHVMSVSIDATASFQPGTARPLFDARLPDFSNPYRSSYDVTPDGQRFLINTASEGSDSPITVVVNWTRLLRR